MNFISMANTGEQVPFGFPNKISEEVKDNQSGATN